MKNLDVNMKPYVPPNLHLDKYIDMTGRSYFGQTFDGCVLVLTRPGVHLNSCQFNYCRFVGPWPAEILERSF